MPVIIAIAIRYVIIAAVQLGLWTLLEKFGIPLLNGAIAGLMQFFGVSEETAKDIMANKILLAFEEVGIFAITLKTKLPIKVAEYLGFTSKGYAVRKITTVAGIKAETEVAKIVVQKTAGKVITAAEATVVVAQAQAGKLGFKIAYDLLIKTVGATFLGFMVVGNWIDFGNWNNGAYQKAMQKFIAWISFGALVPDVDYRKSLTVSDAIFSKIYNTFKLGGAAGIQDPFKGIEVPFTRDNLLDLTDKVGSTLLLTDGTASAKKVLAAVLPMIVFVLGADIDKALAGSAVAPADASSKATSIPITKVFTGIVSQGVVGAGLVFTPRPNDLIESADELRTAAANNLAPFLATLPGKVVYEVKVVASIVTKDGFKQTGTTQRIQTGTYANGKPKYKSVTNKFATLVVYALTDKGSRAKLTTIVLGPVNSAKLTVAENDLRALETELPALVTTTNIDEVQNISTPEPVFAPFVFTPPAEGETVYYKKLTNDTWIYVNIPWHVNIPFDFTPISYEEFIAGIKSQLAVAENFQKNGVPSGYVGATYGPVEIERFKKILGQTNSTSVPAPAPVVSSTEKSATTLFEWYQAQGQTLPSVSVRSKTYEGLGLGPASYYTGTAEQNTKLLNALKA